MVRHYLLAMCRVKEIKVHAAGCCASCCSSDSRRLLRLLQQEPAAADTGRPSLPRKSFCPLPRVYLYFKVYVQWDNSCCRSAAAAGTVSFAVEIVSSAAYTVSIAALSL